MKKLWILFVFSSVVGLYGEEGVEFPSGNVLTPVDESTLTPADRSLVSDVKNTGSDLFDSNGIDQTRLSVNFFVEDFKSSGSNYFRAHPTFMKCLQKIYNHVQSEKGQQVEIESGFRTSIEIGSAPQDPYAQSGTSATLKLTDTSGDVLDIAEGAVFFCSSIFADINRDIGLIITSTRVHVYMTGAEDLQPYFESDGYAGLNTEAFKDWCKDKLDESIDPKKSPVCDDYPSLDVSQTYPSYVSTADRAVGRLDEIVTRDMVEDFARLMQYPATWIEFEDTERSKGWCGSVGKACNNCQTGIVGQALVSRCADRTMSPRMYARLNTLQKLVRECSEDEDKLKVIDAWDEPYEGSPDGDYPSDSLHKEGRAAIIKLSVQNTADDIQKLTNLAICAGFDFVKNEETHVLVAVRKQAKLMTMDVPFPSASLTPVTPPASLQGLYDIPNLVPGTASDYPLFDTDYMENTGLADGSTIGMYKSQDSANRYFRVKPAIVSCFEALLRQETKWNPMALVQINKAFLTRPELEMYVTEPQYDQRGYNFMLGQALEVTYDPSVNGGILDNYNDTYNIERLLKGAIDVCSPIFYSKGKEIGLGLYSSGLYIDMRDNYDLWVEDTALLPPGKNLQDYKDEMEARIELAIQNRVINPDDPILICSKEVAPQKQNPDYVHQHEAHIVKKRRKREAGQAEEENCEATRNTDHCSKTKQHRDTEVEHIWHEVKRKHLWHDETELKAALVGCIGDCGTCVTGYVYEDKTEWCSSFLNWTPFDLLNDEPHVTNFYSKANVEIRRHACQGKRQCMDKAPLYALMGPSLDTLFRPNPDRSVEEELYSQNDNPLPVYEIVHKLFAINAKGHVYVWVNDETEIRDLYHPLRVIFVFNKEVEHIHIYVYEEDKLSSVDLAVQSMLEDWVKTSCPLNTREGITPFTLTTFPSGVVKRSIGNDFNEHLIEQRKYFEREWMKSTTVI